MEWVLIMEMVMEFIKECQENRDREDIEGGLNDPGPREAIAIRRVLRKYLRKKEPKLRGRKLRKRLDAETRNGMEKLVAMPPMAIAALMDEVEEDDED